MDSVRIIKSNAVKDDGRVSKKTFMFKFSFQCQGTVKQVVDYLLSNKVPKIALDRGVSYINSVDKGNGEFVRVMHCPLPDSTLANLFIGSDPIHISYEGAYDDSTLILKSVNHHRLNDYFKFTEILTVSEEDGVLTFEREARVFNGTKFGIKAALVNGDMYEEFFNNSNLALYYGIGQEINE